MENPILRVQELDKIYKLNKFEIHAVNHIDFSIEKGEILGIIGESGSGKSTIARMVSLLEKPSSGKIFFEGKDITNYSGKHKLDIYKKMQMVFQDAVGSFDPRMRIGKAIAEMIHNLEPGLSKNEIKNRVANRLEQVGLKEEYAERYPHELSGGECQRAAFARAIALEPQFLIADEVTSALDVSAQAQIVELMKKLCDKLKVGMLFISHDVALVSSICDHILVMYKGSLVEYGTPEEVIANPKDEYTKTLISNILDIN